LRDSSNCQHNVHGGNTGYGYRRDDRAGRASVSNDHGADGSATLCTLSACFNAADRAVNSGADAASFDTENPTHTPKGRNGSCHAHARRPRWMFRRSGQTHNAAYPGRYNHNRDVQWLSWRRDTHGHSGTDS
jgi:hypothetical protein